MRAAKKRGVAVTAGVTPAHFMLSDLATVEFRTFARPSPPLREEADRKAVIEAIGDGTIDVISSGHDPRGPEDKRLPFADAEPGMAGAETLLAMVLSLVRDGVIDIPRAFDLVAWQPAQLLGVDAGVLEEGTQADIALVDPRSRGSCSRPRWKPARATPRSTGSRCRGASPRSIRAGSGSGNKDSTSTPPASGEERDLPNAGLAPGADWLVAAGWAGF